MNTKARVAARPASWLTLRRWLVFGLLAFGTALSSVRPAAAQEAPALTIASAEELHELVGPIALYPDDLVALVLPASTYPLQVVQAARFLEDRKRDANLQPNEEWDDSIVALLNYPEVVELMNDDLDWTYDLGTAVLNQRADVLNAIQTFRDEAYAAGNLRSDERQTVVRADDTIEIKPADPQVIYVPYYEPERVVVYQPAPVYYYYPRPYPVYYYPYPAGYRFSSGFFWGVNTWFSIGWHSHHVHVYDPFYHGHPYHGFSWHSPFYVRNVFVNVNRYPRYPNYVWEPRYRYGGRPVVRGSEGRVYSSAQRTPRRGALDTNAAAARTREGAAYRTNPAVTNSRSATSVTQPRRGVLDTNAAAARAREGSAYRERSAVAPQRPMQPAEASRQTNETGSADTAPTYRRGGGMSQALERARPATQPNPVNRASPGEVRTNRAVSPRATEGSTGMPREATRVAPRAPAAQAPATRAPVDRGGTGAQRSESGGSYRGNAGGSQRAAQPSARGNSGRSASR